MPCLLVDDHLPVATTKPFSAEAGGLDEDAQAAELLPEYESKIAALERMVGRQDLEIEFLKGALRNAPRPRNATTSVIARVRLTSGSRVRM